MSYLKIISIACLSLSFFVNANCDENSCSRSADQADIKQKAYEFADQAGLSLLDNSSIQSTDEQSDVYRAANEFSAHIGVSMLDSSQ